ncbi:MAG: ATP-binding protein [Aquabacterium sp.]|uniref:sensor histidine kinase n=1 Tax=Aquabacterium sp. TaxID=1872578 RepID=UPI002719B058|nr:ATP-binding protein [Aquabacterium sp.]MDO9006201.1 ATP-binding protein [Aquabacterium sp.]
MASTPPLAEIPTDPDLIAASKPPLSIPDILRRARTLMQVGLALLLLLLSGALGFEMSQRQGMAAVQANAGHRLELFASTVDSLLNRLEHVPATIQLNKDVLAMLRDPGELSRVKVVNGYLKELNSHLGSMVVYILNERGIVVAASNGDETTGFVGEDLAFRPYFLDGLSGKVGRHFAIGNTQGVPGYYLSNPIRDGQKVIGVAVIKISLEPIEQAWSMLGVPALIADENRVVILSSQADWRYTTLTEQTVEQRVDWQLTQRYNLKTLPRFPLNTKLSELKDTQLTEGVVVNGGGLSPHLGSDVLAQARAIDKMHWQLLIFTDLGAVRKQAVLVSLLSCVAAGFVLLLGVVVNQRRRILAQKLESKRVLEQANAELESKVTRRTKALTETNLRLRQEVSERVQAERTLRAAQDELVQAAKLAVLGQLATGITHELSQPLSAIRTLSGNTFEFLKRGMLGTVESNLGIISRLADQMGGILHPLKGFARKAPASPAITDVGQAMNNALLLFNSRLRSEEITLNNDCPEGHTLAWCDPNRLEQVIVNLIGNALDAMREAPLKTLSVSARPTGDGWIRLTVSDTGSGIPEHLLPRLFEPFFTTKPVGIGLGLGLSISQDIVREFHGQLTAENLAEGGARFVLLLPEKGAHEDTPAPAHWPPSA